VASDVTVIGVGNTSRGDDGIGPAVAAAVARRANPTVDVRISTSDPSRLIERWGSAETVIIVDAMLDDSEPGTVAVFDATRDPLPAELDALSSHGMGVSATVELARAMGRLPHRLIVVGVSGDSFEGTGLTRSVEHAVEDAVQRVMEAIEDA
jgi:hydrogenase maturation protease